MFFHRLGFHILSLAPANPNCGHFMQELHKNFPEVDAVRIFPASTEIELAEVNESQAKLDKPGHIGGASVSFLDFELARHAVEDSKYKDPQNLGLQAKVLKAARNGTYKHPGNFTDATGRRIYTGVDYWAVLHDCIEKCKSKRFDWNDVAMVKQYETAYRACKEHYMNQNRFVVTTTGNVRCSEIITNWAPDSRCRGIVYMLDEACKDKEIDTLTALLSKEFQRKIIRVVMTGDDK